MQKNKYSLFLLSISLSIILFIFVSINNVFANPATTSFLLNNSSQNITFNPNNNESVSIEVKANTPVKFTRLYICSINQICNGTSGNYTRYFTQTDISDVITKSWNGKKSGDIEIVPEGEYKVMVSMTEGSSSPIIEFSQNSIFVDFSNVNSTTTNSISTSTNNNPASASTTISSNLSKVSVSTRTVYLSTHSSPDDLSNYTEKNIFEASAGRERMILTGSPLEFNAKYALFQNYQCMPTFRWSFGDGFEAIGKNATHTYKYPGEYQVVLNGICGDYSSISRTSVKVTHPDISILNRTDGAVEIINNGKTEINIGNWKIKNEQKDFVFPQDTIINANNKIILSKEDIGVSSSTSRVSLYNPSDREVAYVNITISRQPISANSPDISVAEAEELLSQYKKTLALNEQQITGTNVINDINKDFPDNKDIIQTASAMEAIDQSSNSFWSKLIDTPIKGIKSFVHIFYDF